MHGRSRPRPPAAMCHRTITGAFVRAARRARLLAAARSSPSGAVPPRTRSRAPRRSTGTAGTQRSAEVAPTGLGPTLRLIRTVARRMRCFGGCVAAVSARRSAWRVASSATSHRYRRSETRVHWLISSCTSRPAVVAVGQRRPMAKVPPRRGADSAFAEVRAPRGGSGRACARPRRLPCG